MGNDLTGTDKDKPRKSPLTLCEIFREAFPQYLAIGMRSEEFWDGDSWLVKSYREAYRIRAERDIRDRDRDAWNLGNYIRFALCSVGITVNGWAPKGARLKPYPEQPFTEKAEIEKQTVDKKKKEENGQQLALAMFQAFTDKMNAGILKRLEKEKNGGKDGSTEGTTNTAANGGTEEGPPDAETI